MWVAHLAGIGFDFIVIAPPPAISLQRLLRLWEYLFFDRFQCPLVNGPSTVSCNFGALTGGD